MFYTGEIIFKRWSVTLIVSTVYGLDISIDGNSIRYKDSTVPVPSLLTAIFEDVLFAYAEKNAELWISDGTLKPFGVPEIPEPSSCMEFPDWVYSR